MALYVCTNKCRIVRPALEYVITLLVYSSDYTVDISITSQNYTREVYNIYIVV